MSWIGSVFTWMGIAAGWLLFWRLAFLRLAGPAPTVAEHASLSVIIPARDEADNLPLLLRDLQAQTLQPLEILCVDDESSDGTPAVARAHGAQVICVARKPAGWVGKSYACHLGAEAAQGRLLLFLDADVRLAPNALLALVRQQEKNGPVVSVQPYHRTQKWYEQLSVFFNLIAAASMAAKLPFGARTRGVFGPVVLLPAQVYHKAGGHAAIRESVIEDMSLGAKLIADDVPCTCLVGGPLIGFRMYGGGVRPLWQGWAKNFATGASLSSFVFVLLVALWISSLCRIPIQLVKQLALGAPVAEIALTLLGYAVLVALLLWAGGKVGRFRPLALVLYPVCLLFFIALFAVSVYKKVFRRPVYWKGRNVQNVAEEE